MKPVLTGACFALALSALGADAQSPNPDEIPPYKPEYSVAGGLRIAGSELKGNVDLLVEGFQKFHPGAVLTTNFITSSEGALGMMFAGVSDVATMGDDAKITDQMPFYNTFREGQDAVMRDGKYLPLTAEVANAELKKLEQAAK